MTLREHRERILTSSGLVNDEERERLYKTVVPHLKKAGIKNFKFKKSDVEIFVDSIIESQGDRPFFWIDSSLPYCWNNPKDWGKYDYIRLQWGHLEPVNSKIACNQLENLCLQSARCNNHIQSSMPLDDVIELFKGSKTEDRIHHVLQARKVLFQTKKWQDMIDRLLY